MNKEKIAILEKYLALWLEDNFFIDDETVEKLELNDSEWSQIVNIKFDVKVKND